MKRNIFFKCFYVLAAIILIFNVVYSLRDELSFSSKELPEGTLCEEFLSPAGDKKISMYLVENCLGKAVRAECTSLKGEADTKNIYWQTDTDVMTVEWLNNSSVLVNGVPLSTNSEYAYDSRNGASLFREGALEGVAEIDLFSK